MLSADHGTPSLTYPTLHLLHILPQQRINFNCFCLFFLFYTIFGIGMVHIRDTVNPVFSDTIPISRFRPVYGFFYGIIPQYYIQFRKKKDRLPDDADALFFSDIYAFAAGANKAARFRTAFHDRNSLIPFFLRDESTATEYDSNRRGFCRGTSGDTAPRERSSQAA